MKNGDERNMSNNLISLMPNVKRARDYYLYDENGCRYLDLYLDGGRAINGHRPSGLSLALKNTLSRGLYAPYPSVYFQRLIRLLQNEFPQFSQIGIYKNLNGFLQSYTGDSSFTDPAVTDNRGDHIQWRPFLEIGENCSMVVLSFPFPGSDVIAVLSSESEDLPESDLIPPYILSGLIRSYYDLKKNMTIADSEDWSTLDDTGHWKRRGPYLVPLCSEPEYGELFKLYLRNQILISPEYHRPSICAVQVKEGSLKSLFKEITGGKGE